MTSLIILLPTAVSAYLLGSVPFGLVVAKIFSLPDPRTIGSGNI
ncbi:MAG: glycerol-3-phosphate acyltransferase, partial [Boseongicola sp.]